MLKIIIMLVVICLRVIRNTNIPKRFIPIVERNWPICYVESQSVQFL
jgi:hypothetical protein